MSLLAGLAGFGAGVTASLAETKKEEMATQRQANLARLQAQYKNEASLAQAEEMGRLATSGDPQDLATAIALGYTPPKPITPKFKRYIDKATGQETTVDESDTTVQSRIRAGELTLAPPGSQVEVNVGDKSQETFATELAKSDVKSYEAISARGESAQRRKTQIDRIKDAMAAGNFKFGALAEQRANIGRLADLFGIDLSGFDLIGESATAEVVNAASEQLAAELMGQLAQDSNIRGSNAILELVRNAGPQIFKNERSLNALLSALDRQADRDVEIAQLAENYIQEYGNLRPEGDVPSFRSAVFKLNQEDPVIDENIRSIIMTGFPRVSLGEMENPTPEQLAAILDRAGVAKGEYFIDDNGIRRQRTR